MFKYKIINLLKKVKKINGKSFNITNIDTLVKGTENEYNIFIKKLLTIRTDLNEDQIKKLLIDEDEYLKMYPDVKKSNILALQHYFLHGFSENRYIPIPQYQPILENKKEKTCYFFNNTVSDHLFKSYKNEGGLPFSNQSDYKDIIYAIFSSNEIIYFNTELTHFDSYIIHLAKSIGLKVTLNNKPIENKKKVDSGYLKFLNALCEARIDLDKDYIEKLLIDEHQYYKNYPEVKEEGLSAAEHFFSYGYKDKRNLPAPKFIPYSKITTNDNKSHLYFSNAPLKDGSFQYRCMFQAQKYNNSFVYNSSADIKKIIRALFLSDKMIFSRPEVNDISLYVIQLAKRIGVVVEFDFDDLLLPEFSDYLGHVRSKFSSPEAANKNVITKLTYLYLADGFRCTSELIATELAKLDKPVQIHPNKLPFYMANQKQDVIDKLEDVKARKIKLIYLSGTATHKKDYSVIHGLLLKLAQQFPNKFTLTFLGNTQQNVAPFKLLLGEENVTIIPRVNFTEMLSIISRHDVALVPLEKTVFNNAKSNIKFIECGSQGTPVLATDSDEFKASIIHGETGWLCSTQDDWMNMLNKIVNQDIDLLPISLAAKKQVESDFMIGK